MNTQAEFKKYLNENYHRSIFDQALKSGEPWDLHLHDHRIVQARITSDQIFDIGLNISGSGETLIPKLQAKILYPAATAKTIRPLIKNDIKVQDRHLEPIIRTGQRHHIKNKTIFPLMQAREVLFFTLLEGEVVRGLITGFSRYDITVSLKGGVPVTIMRHAIFDLRDKKGHCLLKAAVAA